MEVSINEMDRLISARHNAAVFESTLALDKRKSLGQYFTGLPLSRILAALSVRNKISSFIDPMGGHGDLLDAVFERCHIEGLSPIRADAIEVDPETARVCRNRLQVWREKRQDLNLAVYESSAFDPNLIGNLPADGYSLVITNPPYVRYQTFTSNGRSGDGSSPEAVRGALLQIVYDRVPKLEREIWIELVHAYSGLSDLSVPAWLLAAMLVKSGGVLALVAPATWRNRNYADVLQYLLARCFKLEFVIADRQPGWFSKALVRTNLIIATRLSSELLLEPLFSRDQSEKEVLWAEVDKIAKQGNSLVGAAFSDEDPEGNFAKSLFGRRTNSGLADKGIIITKRSKDSISDIYSTKRSLSWLRRIEPLCQNFPLFITGAVSHSRWIPHELREIFPEKDELHLHQLSKAGVQISQGLRTGCNGFFYVDMIEQVDEETGRVLVSPVLGGDEITVPMDALKPVIRRQSELDAFKRGMDPRTYVLDLRQYVLPEDLKEVEEAYDLYKAFGFVPPRVMPWPLIDLVRRAAQTLYKTSKNEKYIPELSAVKTNARKNRSGQIPRFWYMLPDFTRRHLPDAFVPRVNQVTPRVLANRRPPFLIDANFSTLWTNKGTPWTIGSIIGVMNSAWSRACMEAIGTPMGGGALKLEATHLRRLPIPMLSASEIGRIAEITENQSINGVVTEKSPEIDQIIVRCILKGDHTAGLIEQIISELYQLTYQLNQDRQRS